MNRKINKMTFLIASVILLSFLLVAYIKADAAERATVYITVSDITDVDKPFNILVPRRTLTVEQKDLSSYGDTFKGIEAAEGLTYLHALGALHELLYGEDIGSYLMLDDKYEMHIFMGKSIDSIMYKNGDDIFTLPQNVNIKDGDEINVCLYTAGHAQQVATFDKSVIRVPVGEEVAFNVSEHFDSPVENTPISNAQITDPNGLLLFDENGEIIASDELGNFTVVFDEAGVYTISIMPQINYYMKGELNEVITYVPQEVTQTHTYTISEGEIYSTDGLPENVKEQMYPPGEGENVPDYEIFITSGWGDEVSAADGDLNFTWTTTTTELVEVVEQIPDEPKQMITYTPPYCVIDVTSSLIVESVYFGKGELSDGVYINLKNWENSQCTVWCASYDENDRMLDVQSAVPEESVNFAFGVGADYYKVFFWENMTPLKNAYSSK